MYCGCTSKISNIFHHVSRCCFDTGIEAEAVMLGQAISMLLPKVVGYKITGQLNQYATSTDLVLTITKVINHWEISTKSETEKISRTPGIPCSAKSLYLTAVELVANT